MTSQRIQSKNKTSPLDVPKPSWYTRREACTLTSRGPLDPVGNKAYLSDFVKLAGVLTLSSSGGRRRLVMRDGDDTGGSRAEVSLATGRRRRSKSVMKPRNIITYWRTCMVSSEIALTVREQHFQAELNENPPEVRKTCYDNRHLCLQEYHCKQQQTRNITSEPDNSAVEAQPLIIT
ncbi:hypothetical protein CB1_000251005 [Camelus ferus]|nr:hypothetical protein CB1_000251005 [Camelus ferus]